MFKDQMNKKSIQEIGEKQLGGLPIEIIRKKIGICNEVYELKYPSNALYFKNETKKKEWIYGTHRFLSLFQKLHIKVPTIISEDYSKTEYSFCYQIQTKIAGKDLAIVFHELSPSDLKGVAKEVSQIFDKFNTLPYKKNFGGLTGTNEDQIENLLTIIEDKRNAIIQTNTSAKLINKEVVDIYNELIADYKKYFLSVRPKLYYNDMSSKNVMIHNGRFNGLVDLDFLMKGDYLEAIGGIIADWYGNESGDIYINEILKLQKLDEYQQRLVKVYAIFSSDFVDY